MDRVQVIKQESAALGGDDADSMPFPTPINPQEDAIEAAGFFGQSANHRDETHLIRRHDDGGWVLKDVRSPTESALVSETYHTALDSLVHDLAETSYVEFTRDGNGLVTDAITWASAAKLVKVREVNVTRTSGVVTQVVEKHYNTAGTVALQTLTSVIARSGGLVSSITPTLT